MQTESLVESAPRAAAVGSEKKTTSFQWKVFGFSMFGWRQDARNPDIYHVQALGIEAFRLSFEKKTPEQDLRRAIVCDDLDSVKKITARKPRLIFSNLAHPNGNNHSAALSEDPDAFSPLTLAARFGRHTIVDHLCRMGANPHTPDPHGRLAANMLAIRSRGSAETAQILTAFKANYDQVEPRSGLTARQVEAKYCPPWQKSLFGPDSVGAPDR